MCDDVYWYANACLRIDVGVLCHLGTYAKLKQRMFSAAMIIVRSMKLEKGTRLRSTSPDGHTLLTLRIPPAAALPLLAPPPPPSPAAPFTAARARASARSCAGTPRRAPGRKRPVTRVFDPRRQPLRFKKEHVWKWHRWGRPVFATARFLNGHAVWRLLVATSVCS